MKIYIVSREVDYSHDNWLYCGPDLSEAGRIWEESGGYDRILELTEDGYAILKW